MNLIFNGSFQNQSPYPLLQGGLELCAILTLTFVQFTICLLKNTKRVKNIKDIVYYLQQFVIFLYVADYKCNNISN